MQDNDVVISCNNCSSCMSTEGSQARPSLTDCTIDTQLLMNTVHGGKGQHTAALVVLILMGSKSAQLSTKDREILTYGLGKSRKAEYWKLLDRRPPPEFFKVKNKREKNPTYAVTPAGFEVIRGTRRALVNLKSPG
jgi:hypothetical protein